MPGNHLMTAAHVSGILGDGISDGISDGDRRRHGSEGRPGRRKVYGVLISIFGAGTNAIAS